MIDLLQTGVPHGYALRPYAGAPDHPAMVAISNAHESGSGGVDYLTVDEMDNHYAHRNNFDPERDAIVAEGPAGEPVAYGRTEWWDVVEDGSRVYMILVRVAPEHGVVAAPVARWIEQRIDDIAEDHGPMPRKVIWAFSEAREGDPLSAALSETGYAAIAYEAQMIRPDLENIPTFELPDGLEVRPVRPEHLRTIWEADKAAFRDHWGQGEPDETDWEEFLGFPHRDESLWRIAWAGDRVVGQVRSFVNREQNEALERRRGWTEYISTARDWRRRGVARSLICDSLRALRDRGMTEAALGVHVENPNGAFTLYESLGFDVVHQVVTLERQL